MNERIRVKVYPSDPNELILRVLEMPGKWRGLLCERDGKYTVRSLHGPAFFDAGKTLYLRGTNAEYDNHISGWPYPTPEARNEALAAFTRIIRRLNGTEDAGEMVYGVPSGPFMHRSSNTVLWCSDCSGVRSGWHMPMPSCPDFTKPLPALPKAWTDPAPTQPDGTVIE